MVKKQPRFIEAYSQSLAGMTKILIDLATGVNYLYHQNGYSGGLTVLLDEQGKPVITPKFELDER